MGYMVLISAGLDEYSLKAGWDEIYEDRRDAKACAARAGRMDGWSAKVVKTDQPVTVRKDRA